MADKEHGDDRDVDYVAGTGFISDESEFYGDEKTKSRWEERAAAFDVKYYCANDHEKAHPAIPRRAAQNEASPTASGHIRAAHSSMSKQSAAEPETLDHRQTPRSSLRADESVDDFLARLPPRKTRDQGPWIRIERPASDNTDSVENDHDLFAQAGRQIVQKLSETLAENNHKQFAEAGGHILQKLSEVLAELDPKSGPSAQAKNTAKATILAAAKEARIKAGKWILRPSASHVNELWSLIAKETLAGQLGVAAEVGTAEACKDNEKWPIAVYTADIGDMEELMRVLEELEDVIKSRRLMTKVGELYYKPKAYSALGIGSDNKWDLRTSIHSRTNIREWKKKKEIAEREMRESVGR